MNPSDTPYMRLSVPPLLFFASIAVLGTLTANPLLTVASVLVLPLFIRLLWRQDEPPVLLFAISFQWAQVTAKVFHADYLGLDIAALSRSSHVVQAVWVTSSVACGNDSPDSPLLFLFPRVRAK